MNVRLLFALALALGAALALAFLLGWFPAGEPDRKGRGCVATGHWRAREERIGGICPSDRLLESVVVLDLEELYRTDRGARWRVEMSRRDRDVVCSHEEPGADECRWRIHCESELPERARLDYELSIELTPQGALSGSNVVTWSEGDSNGDCEARFLLEGERVSPLELRD